MFGFSFRKRASGQVQNLQAETIREATSEHEPAPNHAPGPSGLVGWPDCIVISCAILSLLTYGLACLFASHEPQQPQPMPGPPRHESVTIEAPPLLPSPPDTRAP